MGQERTAKVIRVVDGDTIICAWDLPLLDLMAAPTIRIKGIDTPETYRPKSTAEAEHGEAATLFLEKIILNEEVELSHMKRELFGRIEAVVKISGADVADLLKENGFEKKKSYSANVE